MTAVSSSMTLPTFVDKGRKQPFNPLVETQTYNKLGKNAYFESKPSILHFGGFAVHHVHKQEVRVLNISKDSKRLHVVPPTTPFFRIQYKKKGLIAPGMSEDLTVEFSPTEYRYYYDCIRIHSEDENLVIPLHGYPVLNSVDFPRMIDFGKAPLRQTQRQFISLGCKVPIEFEYELHVIEPHRDFEVFPTSGIIPANSTTDIQVHFTPTKFSTASMRFQVNVSQLNFEPVTVTVMGSSAPGLVKAMEKATLTTSAAAPITLSSTTGMGRHGGGEEVILEEPSMTEKLLDHPDLQNMVEGREEINKSKVEKLLSQSLLPTGYPTQNGGGGTSTASSKKRAKKSKQSGREGEEEEDVEIKGIRFPKNLGSNFSVSYVLTQQEGKLKIKDLKRTIEKHKEEKRRKEEMMMRKGNRQKMRRPSMVLKMLGGAMSGAAKTSQVLTEDALVSGISEKDIKHVLAMTDKPSRQTKEMMFKQVLSDAEKEEREKNVRWFVCSGRPLMEEVEVEGVYEARKKAAKRADQISDLLAGQRRAAEMSRDRVVHDRDREERIRPNFDPFVNDFFRVRKEVLDKYMQKVRVITARYRVDTRLKAIKATLKAKGMTLGGQNTTTASSLLKQQSSLVSLTATKEGKGKTVGFEEGESSISIPLHNKAVSSAVFPVYVESEFRQLRPVHVPELEPFEDWDYLALKVPVYYRTMGYTPISIATVQKYISSEEYRPLLQGAEEEAFPRAPRGEASTSLVPAVQNEALLAMPSNLFTAGEYPTVAPTFAPVDLLAFDETSTSYLLRPRPLPIEDAYLHESVVGSTEVVEIAFRPSFSLSSVYRQRREMDSAMMLDDLPSLLAVDGMGGDGSLEKEFGRYEVDEDEDEVKAVPDPPSFDAYMDAAKVKKVVKVGEGEEGEEEKEVEEVVSAAVVEIPPPAEEGESVLHSRVIEAEVEFVGKYIGETRKGVA
eukprot:CAMPEP_0113878408 /NCGR_PEP_ID=MMETSP0780_2-20120614/6661_1 /TAXON_ID=652834 /ORGANISM="Palpitomonas bilix" /LENGTH=949 /DNA_ID=CAMNT_0000864865 /DNA_START=261 /DNA_END=3110 /DNA_ORIENTATION=+ /assembly_acc=CAM_ASM_000599